MSTTATSEETRKVFAVYDRYFDPLYASQDQCLHITALDKSDALKQAASALRCEISALKAFEVRS